MTKKGNTLTREQAAELYKDLQRNMNALKLKSAAGRAATGGKAAQESKSVASEIAASIKEAMRRDTVKEQSRSSYDAPVDTLSFGAEAAADQSRNGAVMAVMVLLFAAAIKVVMSFIDYTGVFAATTAHAALDMGSSAQATLQAFERATPVLGEGEFSKQEIAILTSLDVRRAELEERRKIIEARSKEIEEKEGELSLRMAELRDLTDRLNLERDKTDKRRTTQLDQLANVYGSMNPPEAAQLLEQLDIAIALDLIERMPEKRIGQILSLMKPERALTITKMLSNKVKS